MSTRHVVVVLGIAGMLLGAILVYPAASNAAQQCGGQHRLEIEDLGMVPDPVADGQPIRSWNVTLRVDQGGECDTVLTVREAHPGKERVGREAKERLRPGINRLSFPAEAGYRFQKRETCFIVTADIFGSQREIDAKKRFCATSRWSLR
jgi:hypothetical protein